MSVKYLLQLYRSDEKGKVLMCAPRGQKAARLGDSPLSSSCPMYATFFFADNNQGAS